MSQLESTKIDIRILILSVGIHFLFYGLLSLVSKPVDTLSSETIEVVINDANDEKPISNYIPKLDQSKLVDNNSKATVMSDEKMRFEKETISKNMGIAKNSTTSKAQTEVQKQKELDHSTEGFMPLERNPSINRTSSIHLNLPHIENGSFTFLNADFSTYASFFNRIGPNIIGQWGGNIREFAYFPQVRDQLLLKDRWVTRIEIILDRKGYLKDVIVINSAGLRELDHAVIDAIKDSAPFLNPPSGMIESDGYVHIHGQFSVLTRQPRLAN